MPKNQTHSEARELWIQSWSLSDSRERIIERLDRMGAPYTDDDVDFFELIIEERVFRFGSILMKLLVSKLTPKQRAPWSVMLGEFSFTEAAKAVGETVQCLHKKTQRLSKRLMNR